MATLKSALLASAIAQNYSAYDQLLSLSSPSDSIAFWDDVVLTASNEHQKGVYERKIAELAEENQIPGWVRFHVVDDPPRYKIGSGGSTLLVLKYLDDIYGSDLDSRKILLIHAGGYSTRLPHVSPIGKIFLNLPAFGGPKNCMPMLVLKLIMYIGLIRHLSPGVFLTSADTIELIAMPENGFTISSPGFIALAHPSSLTIGTTHGVYCIDDPKGECTAEVNKLPEERRPILKKCDKFLHKPTVKKMREHGAIIEDQNGEEFVYTDSVYFFDHNCSKVLLKILSQIQPLTYELEAWSDFLPFGAHTPCPPSADYSVLADPLSRARSTILRTLQTSNISLSVLVLNSSKFYHIGTMQEYIECCCINEEFQTEMQIRFKGNLKGVCVMGGNEDAWSENYQNFVESVPPAILENVKVEEEGEHTRNQGRIGCHSILVNVNLTPGVDIPDYTCMFTMKCHIPSQQKPFEKLPTAVSKYGYVTFIFSTKDDMKASHSLETLGIFNNVPVNRVLHPSCVINDTDEIALWNLPMFPIMETKEESVKWALWIIDRIVSWKDGTKAEDGLGREKQMIHYAKPLAFVSLKMGVELFE
ncbi:2744_t:CDS:2 [Paraglomus occultum]|uniref:2744_t:CDS:1 n=1 Tax=Paraglomus occultum TaxID=144539 RepID=A0A9N8VYU5_9GLOM|nr:2744_t:CDS:2 [Paraglomus occultum]